MRKFVPFVAVVALVAAAPAQAQQSCEVNATTASTCTIPTTLSMTMPSIMELTLSATSLSLPTPQSIGDFNANGLVSLPVTGPNVDVRSNRAYRVQISSAANFTHQANGGGSFTKPAGELSWSVDGGTTTTAMSTTPTDILSGSATNAATQETVTYLTAYDITRDKPGSYSLAVTFTLIAP